MHLSDSGGPPQHVRPWLGYLAAKGTLEVVAPRAGPVLDLYAPLARTTVLPYRPLMFPHTPLSAVRLVSRLAAETMMFRRHMRRTRPDLVVVVTAVLPAAVVAARLERIPAIVYVGEILGRRFPPSRARAAAGWSVLRLTGRASSGLVCCSHTVARQFDGSRCEAVISTAYPGIEPQPLGGDRSRLRRAHGIDEGDPCLAVVGNIARGRGQDLVIRALPRIRRTFPTAHCLIAGRPLDHADDLAYSGELVRLVADLRLAEAVSFTGFVEAVGDVYAAADIVVNPVRVEEAFGRVAVEALAAGKPVVAAHVGAIPEVLTDGEHAVLVEPNDPAAIADAVLRLLEDGELRGRLAAQGRAHVMANFTEDAGTGAFARVVDAVLHGNCMRTRRPARPPNIPRA